MAKAESTQSARSGAKKSAGAKPSPNAPRPAKATAAKTKAAKTKASRAKAGKTKAAHPRFGPEFLEEMRRKLLKERAKYLHSAEEYQAEAESLLATREPGDVQFDEEGGEGTTVAVERERDLALSSQARHTVGQIDAALARLDDGTYGFCVTSGAPIPKARLRAIPWAAERVEVKAGGLGRR